LGGQGFMQPGLRSASEQRAPSGKAGLSANVRLWPIADSCSGELALTVLMSASDP
jgi:hypothetical protein